MSKPTIKQILHTADGITDKPLETNLELPPPIRRMMKNARNDSASAKTNATLTPNGNVNWTINRSARHAMKSKRKARFKTGQVVCIHFYGGSVGYGVIEGFDGRWIVKSGFTDHRCKSNILHPLTKREAGR